MKGKKEIIEKICFHLYIISLIIAGFILCYRFMGEEPDTVGGIALCYLCFCAYIYHKHKLNESWDMHKKVAWISNIYYFNLTPSHLRTYELAECIEIQQRKLNISHQYCIDFSNENEKEYLSQILNKHKEQVIRDYFYNDNPKSSKGIYELTSLEYYFFSLHCFVYDNTSNYKDTESYGKKEYISNWEFKCQLSEYGRVYYKLELITRSYIESNDKVQKLFTYIDKERRNHVIEVLDKNEVGFLSYRP